MIFIALLILSAFSIATSAAFFSVYGLANTFSGTFWGVVVMGASLEAGKLMTASYLYRYWEHTHIALRSVLLSVCFAVMLLTSGGIFGFLSTGYQSDVLPLKQKADQVKMLEEERTRSLARKVQIDDLLAKNTTTVTNVQAADGSVDKNAAKVLRETTRSRESMVKQYREEQKQVTSRITELDKQMLPLKQDLIKTEAHVGPIIYIAKAFDLDSDNATKYLIYLIIFAFDPMAIALTLAVNVALRVRKEEKETANRVTLPVPDPLPPAPEPEPEKIAPPVEEVEPMAQPRLVEPYVPNEITPIHNYVSTKPELLPTASTFVMSQPDSAKLPEPSPIDNMAIHRAKVEASFAPDVAQAFLEHLDRATVLRSDSTPVALSVPEQDALHRALVNSVKVIEPIVVSPVVDLPINNRPMPTGTWGNGPVDAAKINELISHYQYLKNKKGSESQLTREEMGEFRAIATVLQKHGFSLYL